MKRHLKESDLTQEMVREVFDYDPETGILRRKASHYKSRIGEVAGCLSKVGYWVVGIGSDKNFYAHRVIFLYVYGYIPKQVDHINGIRTDNRLSNLRAASKAENMRNKGPTKANTSGVPGVHWASRPAIWCARIKVDRKTIHLGHFHDFNEAVKARKAGEIKYWGEFAPTRLAA